MRVEDEIEQLRDDIRVLRVLVDAALDRGADELLLRACASLLRERRERLEELERLTLLPSAAA